MTRLFSVFAVAVISGFIRFDAHARQPDFSGTWVLERPSALERVGSSKITPPQRIKHVPPQYPPAAQQQKRFGTVFIDTTVDERGLVSDLRVVRSISGLDRAALTAVSQWQYSPVLLNGTIVPFKMLVKVEFSLMGSNPPAPRDPVMTAPGAFIAARMRVTQTAQGMKIVRMFENYEETSHYDFAGRLTTNTLPRTGSSVTGEYRYSSRWEDAKLVTRIEWISPEGSQHRLETLGLQEDRIVLELTEPRGEGAVRVARTDRYTFRRGTGD